MALSQSDLTELLESLRAADSVVMVRRALQRMLQELIEAEATTVIGAAPYQRSPERTTQRNGHRDRLLPAPGPPLGRARQLRTGCAGPCRIAVHMRLPSGPSCVVNGTPWSGDQASELVADGALQQEAPVTPGHCLVLVV
ncbi:transposase [Nonomuraea sp. NPDC052129]|uniref:transposase n=1 Tax=Nonomuraea sp. NPDC052129 TaxID=3154651 RepID=UPI00342D22C9